MRNTTVALQVSRIRKKRERGREKEGNNDYWLGEIYIRRCFLRCGVSRKQILKIETASRASKKYTDAITKHIWIEITRKKRRERFKNTFIRFYPLFILFYIILVVSFFPPFFPPIPALQ